MKNKMHSQLVFSFFLTLELPISILFFQYTTKNVNNWTFLHMELQCLFHYHQLCKSWCHKVFVVSRTCKHLCTQPGILLSQVFQTIFAWWHSEELSFPGQPAWNPNLSAMGNGSTPNGWHLIAFEQCHYF